MTNGSDEVFLIAAISHAIVLLICALSGPLCIIVGSRMYGKGVSEKANSELSGMGLKLVLKSAGPGLFLISYGVVLLAFLGAKQFEFSDSETANRAKTALDGKQANLEPYPRIIAVAAAALPASAPAETPPCILRTRTVKFQDGGGNLSPESIAAATRLAIDGILRAGEAGIQTDKDRVYSLSVLTGLEKAAREMR